MTLKMFGAEVETIASKAGRGGHAEGYLSQATGLYSHAEGNTTVASGAQAHAEGWINTASGTASYASGYNSTASGEYARAQGYANTAPTYYSTASGSGAYAYVSGGISHSSTQPSSSFGTTLNQFTIVNLGFFGSNNGVLTSDYSGTQTSGGALQNVPIVPLRGSMLWRLDLLCRKPNTVTSTQSWVYQGFCARDGSGNARIVGTPALLAGFSDTNLGSVSFSINTTNSALTFTVQPAAATSTVWFGTLYLTEMTAVG